jgi:hypothetical protein
MRKVSCQQSRPGFSRLLVETLEDRVVPGLYHYSLPGPVDDAAPYINAAIVVGQTQNDPQTNQPYEGVALDPGPILLRSQIQIINPTGQGARPFTLTTYGSDAVNPVTHDVGSIWATAVGNYPAQFYADPSDSAFPNSSAIGTGFIYIQGDNVTLANILINGNNRNISNAQVIRDLDIHGNNDTITGCAFYQTGVASIYSSAGILVRSYYEPNLPSHGFQYPPSSDCTNVFIKHNSISYNGVSGTGSSDGIFVENVQSSVIAYNHFAENNDVDLILFHALATEIGANDFYHYRYDQPGNDQGIAHAAIQLEPTIEGVYHGDGNFSASNVDGNFIEGAYPTGHGLVNGLGVGIEYGNRWEPALLAPYQQGVYGVPQFASYFPDPSPYWNPSTYGDQASQTLNYFQQGVNYFSYSGYVSGDPQINGGHASYLYANGGYIFGNTIEHPQRPLVIQNADVDINGVYSPVWLGDNTIVYLPSGPSQSALGASPLDAFGGQNWIAVFAGYADTLNHQIADQNSSTFGNIYGHGLLGGSGNNVYNVNADLTIDLSTNWALARMALPLRR